MAYVGIPQVNWITWSMGTWLSLDHKKVCLRTIFASYSGMTILLLIDLVNNNGMMVWLVRNGFNWSIMVGCDS